MAFVSTAIHDNRLPPALSATSRWGLSISAHRRRIDLLRALLLLRRPLHEPVRRTEELPLRPFPVIRSLFFKLCFDHWVCLVVRLYRAGCAISEKLRLVYDLKNSGQVVFPAEVR
jgi:hypothetical protein